MIDFTKIPEMFFFTPYRKEELIDELDLMRDMYIALLDIDAEHALDLMNETLSRALRFLLAESPETKFDLRCRLYFDKEAGCSRLTHEGLLNLLLGCLCSKFNEENLKEHDCMIAKKLLIRNIGQNQQGLENAGYGDLLDLMFCDEDELYIGQHFTLCQRPNPELLMKAAEEDKIQWHKFMKDIKDDDADQIIKMMDDQVCAAKVLESLLNSMNVTLPNGEDFRMGYAQLKADVINDFPFYSELNKKHFENKELESLILEKDELLREKDEEIARLRALLRKNGLNADEEVEEEVEEDLSEFAEVKVPTIVLKHFRGSRSLALRYLKGCLEHNNPTKAAQDFAALGSKVIHHDEKAATHGIGKALCGWLNANGCSLNYDTFKSAWGKYDKK